MPKTTAKLLELDYLHRVNNPLGPRLAARLRWEVAKTLKSEYGMEVASADRNKPAALAAKRHEGESVAIEFAKKLTLEGHAITDEEFAELLEYFELRKKSPRSSTLLLMPRTSTTASCLVSA